MLYYSDRKKLEEEYYEYLKDHPQVSDCSFNVITFLCSKGYLNESIIKPIDKNEEV